MCWIIIGWHVVIAVLKISDQFLSIASNLIASLNETLRVAGKTAHQDNECCSTTSLVDDYDDWDDTFIPLKTFIWMRCEQKQKHQSNRIVSHCNCEASNQMCKWLTHGWRCRNWFWYTFVCYHSPEMNWHWCMRLAQNRFPYQFKCLAQRIVCGYHSWIKIYHKYMM